MPTFIALLRGINVGGRKILPMADLRRLAGSLGLRNAKTLLQSGNLVFDEPRRSAASLERLLEAETKQRLDAEVCYLVRSAAEWSGIVGANPWPKLAEDDPGHLLMMALQRTPGDEELTALRGAFLGRETIEVVGRQLYIHYPDGVARSKLSNALIERKLGCRGTARNWNTVLKLAAAAGG